MPTINPAETRSSADLHPRINAVVENLGGDNLAYGLIQLLAPDRVRRYESSLLKTAQGSEDPVATSDVPPALAEARTVQELQAAKKKTRQERLAESAAQDRTKITAVANRAVELIIDREARARRGLHSNAIDSHTMHYYSLSKSRLVSLIALLVEEMGTSLAEKSANNPFAGVDVLAYAHQLLKTAKSNPNYKSNGRLISLTLFPELIIELHIDENSKKVDRFGLSVHLLPQDPDGSITREKAARAQQTRIEKAKQGLSLGRIIAHLEQSNPNIDHGLITIQSSNLDATFSFRPDGSALKVNSLEEAQAALAAVGDQYNPVTDETVPTEIMAATKVGPLANENMLMDSEKRFMIAVSQDGQGTFFRVLTSSAYQEQRVERRQEQVKEKAKAYLKRKIATATHDKPIRLATFSQPEQRASLQTALGLTDSEVETALTTIALHFISLKPESLTKWEDWQSNHHQGYELGREVADPETGIVWRAEVSHGADECPNGYTYLVWGIKKIASTTPAA